MAAPALDAPWLDRPGAGRPMSVADFRARCATLPPPGPARLVHHVIAPRPGAILVPVVDLGGEAALVITKRAPDMLHNGGDWVFPGGRFDAGADVDTADTARREACEELGLAPDAVDLVGRLASCGPIPSGFLLDVFVGVADPAELRPDPREVADVAVVPISVLSSRAAYREEAAMPAVNSGPSVALSRPFVQDPNHVFGMFRLRPGEDLWGMQHLILRELLEGLFV